MPLKKTFAFRRRTISYDVFYVEANTPKEALRLIREGKQDTVEHTDEIDQHAPYEDLILRKH